MRKHDGNVFGRSGGQHLHQHKGLKYLLKSLNIVRLV